jgi:pyridoxal biosynthesis lyase PdxS
MDVVETSTVGEVSFDGGNVVYYEGSATKAEAQALGQHFESKGFFRGRGVNVFLARHPDRTTLAFIVADGVWNNPGKVSNFEAIVRDVAPKVGGLPIEMHLVTPQLHLEKDELIQ